MSSYLLLMIGLLIFMLALNILIFIKAISVVKLSSPVALVFIMLQLIIITFFTYLFYISGVEKLGDTLINIEQNLLPEGVNTLYNESMTLNYFEKLLTVFFVAIPGYGIIANASIIFIKEQREKDNLFFFLLGFGFALLASMNAVAMTYSHYREASFMSAISIANCLLVCELFTWYVYRKYIRTNRNLE